MDVLSICPLRIAGLFWRPRAGIWALTIVCKATYRLVPGRALLSEQQEDPNEDDNYWDDDPSRSMYAPSDVVPPKPSADVVLVGSAFAPPNEAVSSLVARVDVGSINKAIEVFGDRHLTAEGKLVKSSPFRSMPLRYERAAGGPGTSNPVGVRLDATPDSQGWIRLPNLQPVGLPDLHRGMPIEPIAYGPLAPTWPTRLAKLGQRVSGGEPFWWRERPLPEGFEREYFNVAPLDQRLDTLHGDESIVLHHLNPEYARMEVELPGVRPAAFLELLDRPTQEIAGVGDTLWIDTDRVIATLTWRFSTPVAHPEVGGRVVIAMLKVGERLSWADLEQRMGGFRSELIQQRVRLTTPSVSGVAAAAPPLIASSPGNLLDPGATSPMLIMQQAPVMPFVRRPQDIEERQPALPHAADWGSPPVAPPPLVQLPQLFDPGEGSAGLAQQASSADPARAGRRRMGKEQPEATVGSALEASNAAAASGWVSQESPGPVEATPRAPRRASQGALELIGYDPAALPRIRKHPEWKALIAGSKTRSREEEHDADGSGDKRKEAKERRDVLIALQEAEPLDGVGIERALAGAMEDGVFVPPLVVVVGEIEFLFDEVEALKATIATVTPFMGSDKRVKDAVDAANELLKAQAIGGAGALAEEMAATIKKALPQSPRGVLVEQVELNTTRMLLRQRHYQKRTLLGKEWLVCLLTPAVSGAQLSSYVPGSLGSELPMFQRMNVRIIAEVRSPVDQYAANTPALTVVALTRLVRSAQ